MLATDSGFGGVPGTPDLDPRVPQMMTAEGNTAEDYLHLFLGHSEQGRRIGTESLARLEPRLGKSNAHVSVEAWGNQLQAILRWGDGENSAWSRLEELTLPVLVANGAHDVMVDSRNSVAMAQRLSNGQLSSTATPATAFSSSTPRIRPGRPRLPALGGMRVSLSPLFRVEVLAVLDGERPPRSQLLYDRAGGRVVFSMNGDRKAAGHLAKAAGTRNLVPDVRPSPQSKFPGKQDDVETAHQWLLSQGNRPEKLAGRGHSVGCNDDTRRHALAERVQPQAL